MGRMNKKKRKIYFSRHLLFFLFVIIIGIVIKKNPWLIKNIISIRLQRKVYLASNKNVEPVYTELLDLLGPDKCTRNSSILTKYSVDRSHHPPGFPDIITFPESTEEVSSIMKICYKYDMIVIPMGMNSGLEGQTIATHGGVIVNTQRMRKIVEIYPDDFQVSVQPGLRISELNKELEDYGLFFAVAPGSDPFIGGAVSTRASGTMTPKYATVKENTVRLEIVLGSGEVFVTRSRAIKSAAGYDLTSIFIGSEGTLGVITMVTVKVYPVPAKVSSAVVSFSELSKAARTVIGIKEGGIQGVARMEIVNIEAIRAVNNMFGTQLELKPSLFLEFHGKNEEDVKKAAQETQKISDIYGGMGYKFTLNEEERTKLWQGRNSAYYACSKIRKDCKSCRLYSTDVCVPLSKFAQIITQTENIFKKNGLICPIVGHAADANFHVIAPIDFDNKTEVDLLDLCDEKMIELAIKNDGTCTGEHGIGIGKKEHLIQELGQIGVNLMRKIKHAIDPKNMMNPNKIFD